MKNSKIALLTWKNLEFTIAGNFISAIKLEIRYQDCSVITKHHKAIIIVKASLNIKIVRKGSRNESRIKTSQDLAVVSIETKLILNISTSAAYREPLSKPMEVFTYI